MSGESLKTWSRVDDSTPLTGGPFSADDLALVSDGQFGAKETPVSIDSGGDISNVVSLTTLRVLSSSGLLELGGSGSDVVDVVDGNLRFSALSNVGEIVRLDTSNGIDLEPSGTTIAHLNEAVHYPVWIHAANETTAVGFISTLATASYLGRAKFAYSQCIVRCRVTTAAATITWAEVAIASGAFAHAANQSLSLRGFTSVAATFNSTGLKSTTVSLSGVTPGMDLYAIFGSQATTPYDLRGAIGDNISSGVSSIAITRPSTMAAPTTFTLSAGGSVPWCSGVFT